MNKQQAALLSIFSNTALIIFKLIAGIMMNSISVISEAIHSSLDLMASFIAFFSIRKAVTPEDEDHQYGHAKYENVSGFAEAILIFFAAALIIYEASKKIVEGTIVHDVGPGLIVMAVSSLVNLAISTSLFRISKKTHSIALEADAMHLLTDVFTSLGVFVGLILLKVTGINLLDPIFAIMVAFLIIKAAYDLTVKSLHDLVDASLPKEELDIIKEIVSENPDIKGYHKLRTRKCGDKREIDVHIQIDRSTTLEDAHKISYAIEEQINNRLTSAHTIIHIEPSDN